MPAGFATFLANIGQLPDGSESPGFDQRLAAAPIAVAPATNAAATIKTGPAPAAEAAAPQIDMPPLEDVVRVEAPVVRTRSEERRVGRECVSTCRSRGSRCHENQSIYVTSVRVRMNSKK